MLCPLSIWQELIFSPYFFIIPQYNCFILDPCQNTSMSGGSIGKDKKMLKQNLRTKSALTLIFGLSLLCIGAFAQADYNQGDNHSNQGDNHRNNGDRYHYREGHWYGQGEVLVSDPAIGAVVETLPPQNTTVVVGNGSYYYDNTRYYSRSPDGTYIVVAAPQNR